MTHTDPRALRSRQVMIEAATRLLRRGGVEAVTHQTVAAEAGVGRATVYRHWPRLTDLLMDAFASVAPVVDFGEGDLRQRLLHELGLRLSEINSPVAMMLVGVLIGRSEHDAEVHALRGRIFGAIVDRIAEVIAAAAAEGQLDANAPAHELAVMILGALLNERALLGRLVTTPFLETVVDAALRGWWCPEAKGVSSSRIDSRAGKRSSGPQRR